MSKCMGKHVQLLSNATKPPYVIEELSGTLPYKMAFDTLL